MKICIKTDFKPQLDFILWGNFLYIFAMADTGLSPALPLIGLILVKERTVEAVYLTTSTIIKYYSVQGQMDIKKYIRATKQHDMCLSLSSGRRRPRVSTDEVGLKCNRQASYQNDFVIETIWVASV